MNYSVITENDESEWSDRTGELYHFPNKFIKLLQIGTRVVYYKGRLVNKNYSIYRMAKFPHYFGIGTIDNIYRDANSSTKINWFAAIKDFQRFENPVPAKIDGKYLETINPQRPKSHWRDGVRKTTEEVFHTILQLNPTFAVRENLILNDQYQGLLCSLETYIEGAQTQSYVTKYERNPILREQAINIHGLSCMACGFNFEEVFGEYGKGFIHVHHIKPLSSTGEMKVDPKNDLIVLCANCHSMVHRKKNNILSIEELIQLLKK